MIAVSKTFELDGDATDFKRIAKKAANRFGVHIDFTRDETGIQVNLEGKNANIEFVVDELCNFFNLGE